MRSQPLARGLLLLTALCSLTLAAAPAHAVPASSKAKAAATTCLPLGGLLVSKTTRRDRSDGSEVTERLGNGVYRVTRCDRDGALERSMTVAPVADPDGGSVLAPALVVTPRLARSMDYGDRRDPRWAKSWREARTRVHGSILQPTSGTPREDPAFERDRGRATARIAADESCEDGKFVKTGARWPANNHPWRWNADRFGGNEDTRKSLEAAHEAWDITYTKCDFGDITEITPFYAGETTKVASKNDSVSTVDRGDIAAVGCPGALACAFTWHSNGIAVEADIRFSDDVKWSNSGKDGAYDYRAVATHEVGHVIGLADLHDNPKLTMYYATKTGSTGGRTLGRGDIKGLRELYP